MPNNIKKIYKLSRLDKFTFNFFAVQFSAVVLFLFYFKFNYIAWASLPVAAVLSYCSISKRYSFSQKAIGSVWTITAYLTYAFILYGKSYKFIGITFITPIVFLILLRYFKMTFIVTAMVFIMIATTLFFDFYGFDLGHLLQSQTDIYNEFFYFTFVMVVLYLVVMLISRTILVGVIINNLKIKNKELNDSKHEMKQIQIDKESFFATLSHEIRTPINAIKGISDILKSTPESRSDAALFDIMDFATNHLLGLVNNMLDFTKLNDGVFQLQCADFDLSKAVHTVFNMKKSVAEEKGLAFNLEVADNIPNSIFGDKNRICQVIINILNNAIEHTEAGSITLKVSGKYATGNTNTFKLKVAIKDTGKGIDSNLREKLFEKYASSNATNSSVGLGLKITKGIIELMKGTITYKSALNKGTTFCIRVPIAVATNSSSSTKTQVHIPYLETEFLDVLLVDDNNINLLVLEKQLKNKLKNSKITICNNGLEALNLVATHKFDFVLMDIVMPIMDGITAAMKIRNLRDESKKNIPIFALSANVGDNEIRSCINAGMNAFITKPFEINALLQTVFSNTKPSELLLRKRLT